MGVFLRQSFWSLISSYGGVVLGFYLTGFLIPGHFTDPEDIGLRSVLFDFSMIGAQICLFGFGTMTSKFYPIFKREGKNDQGLLFFSFVVSICFFVLTAGVVLLFREPLVAIYEKKSPLFVEYFYLVFPVTFFLVINQLCESYSRARFKIAFPNFNRNILFRLLFIAVIYAHAIWGFGMQTFWHLWALTFAAMALGVLVHITRIKDFSFAYSPRLFKRFFFKPIMVYGGFNFLTTASSTLAVRIDIIMITSILGLRDAAIYAFAVYMVTLIDLPKRVVLNVSMPIVSNLWKDRDIKGLGHYYKRISYNQFAFGLLVFGGVYLGMDGLYEVMPKGKSLFIEGKWVVVILACSKLLDMAFSVSGSIISFSRLYRHNLWLAVGMATAAVLFNYTFIPKWGIEGAALATLSAMTLFNVGKYLVVWRKLKIQPLTWRLLIGAVVFVVSVIAVDLVVDLANPIVSILVRGGLFALVYSVLILLLKVSDDYNRVFQQILSKLK